MNSYRPFGLDEAEVALCRHYAETSSLGGRSSIRVGADRMAHLNEDQFVAQLGHLAFHIWRC
jgi:hypothetical protein